MKSFLTVEERARLEGFNASIEAALLRNDFDHNEKTAKMLVFKFAFPLLIIAVVLGLAAEHYDYSIRIVTYMCLTCGAGLIFAVWGIGLSTINNIRYSVKRREALSEFA